MEILDIILILVLLFGAYRGFKKGFVYTVALSLAFVLGTIGSFQLAGKCANYLSTTFDIHSAWLPFTSYVLVFIGIILLVVLLAKVLEKFLKTAALGWLNKLAGVLLGIFKMAFFASVIFWLLNLVEKKIPVLTEARKANSFLYKPVAILAPAVLPKLKTGYKQLEEKFKNQDP
jgi:membrane protein required for colicin V production